MTNSTQDPYDSIQDQIPQAERTLILALPFIGTTIVFLISMAIYNSGIGQL